MDEALIYTLVRGADWRQAEAAGEYRGSADDAHDGFLHFSTAAQVRGRGARPPAGGGRGRGQVVEPVRDRLLHAPSIPPGVPPSGPLSRRVGIG